MAIEKMGALAVTILIAASDSLNPQAANIKCSGANDEVQINEAFAALPAVGGIVKLMEGTFTTAAPIAHADHNQAFEGSGNATIVVGNFNDNIIECANYNHCKVRNMRLYGAGAVNAANRGIDGDNVEYMEISGVTVEHCGGQSIYIQDATSESCNIHDNEILDGNVSGINLSGIDHIVKNNVIDIIAGWGIYLAQAQITRYLIDGNTVKNCSSDGISNPTSFDCKIIGNTVESCLHGINVDDALGNQIIGNYCHLNLQIGIRLKNAGNSIVMGNYLHNNCQAADNTYSEIWIGNSGVNYTDYTVITNNRILCDETNKAKYGIEEDSAGCDYNYIAHNIIEGPVTGDILVLGPHTIAYTGHVDIFMDVLAVSANHVVDNEDLSAGLEITFTIAAQPDVPRTLSGHFDSHAQITAYTIEITGINAKGITVTETLTEADGWDWETSNAFASEVSVVMTERTGTGVGDTMDIGITDVVGLSDRVYSAADIYKIKKNTANAVVAGAQVDTDYDTYDMAVITLAATDDFTIWFRTNLNITA